jgi:outer membrane protein assembly factor BamB
MRYCVLLTTTALITLSGAGTSQPASAADIHWTGWLGPERNGWVKDFEAPAKWPVQLTKGWQVEVGTGYGSPLVTAGRIYQHARQGENEVLWCLDLKTGDVQWRQQHAVPFKASPGGEWHGTGPKSSPVLADGRIFTMSITGDLSAWNADSGELLWRSDYGSHFEQNRPNWGVSTSPIVDGNRVVVHFGNDNEGALVALDVATGNEIWSQGSDGPSYSSPLVAEIHDVRQIVEWNHEALVGVDSQSGRLLWRHPFPHRTHNQNMPTPAFHNGRILLGGENRGVYSLEPRLSDGVWSVKQRWSQEKVALDMSSAVVNGNLLYGLSHYSKGQFFCLDTDSGKIRWLGPGRTGQNVMFLSVPGHIVALIDSGELQMLAASGDSYKKVAAWKVADSPTWAPPVLLQHGVLVKDQQSLIYWSLAESADNSASSTR